MRNFVAVAPLLVILIGIPVAVLLATIIEAIM